MDKNKLIELKRLINYKPYDTMSDMEIKNMLLEVIKAALAEPNEELGEGPSQKTSGQVMTKWRAEEDGDYYYIDDSGYAAYEVDDMLSGDDFRYLTGNYYKTQEEAEQALKRIEAKGRLDHAHHTIVGNWKPDWTDEWQEKIYVYFNHRVKKFTVSDYFTIQDTPDQWFFETEKQAERFIAENEADLLLLFNVE